MESEATEIGSRQAEAVPQSVLLSRNNESNEKFESKEATETTCAPIKSIMDNTDLDAIEKT